MKTRPSGNQIVPHGHRQSVLGWINVGQSLLAAPCKGLWFYLNSAYLGRKCWITRGNQMSEDSTCRPCHMYVWNAHVSLAYLSLVDECLKRRGECERRASSGKCFDKLRDVRNRRSVERRCACRHYSDANTLAVEMAVVVEWETEG
jgi:hypothetical protein